MSCEWQSRSAVYIGLAESPRLLAMSLSQGAIEGIKKGDIANEPVTLKVTASLSRSAVLARSKGNNEHARLFTVMSGN